MTKNTRSVNMWKFLKKSLPKDFFGFDISVVDLGCGYADLATYCAMNGASRIMAIDSDPEMIQAAIPKIMGEAKAYLDLSAYDMDISYYVKTAREAFDLGICTSVLPYFPHDEQDRIVRWLKRHCEYTLLEYQYAGDGPGERFSDGEQLTEWLKGLGFSEVERIGHTIAKKDKEYRRDLWLCRK